jgi:hypothetical protein
VEEAGGLDDQGVVGQGLPEDESADLLGAHRPAARPVEDRHRRDVLARGEADIGAHNDRGVAAVRADDDVAAAGDLSDLVLHIALVVRPPGRGAVGQGDQPRPRQ